MAGNPRYGSMLAKWITSGGTQEDFDLLEVSREIMQATADGKLSAEMFEDAIDEVIPKVVDSPDDRVYVLFRKMMKELAGE